MSETRAPGVTIDPLPYKGPRPIESLATAVLAIVGFYTPKANSTPNDLAGKPVRVTSWADFTDKYNDAKNAVSWAYLHQAMRGYFINGGKQAYVVGIPSSNAITKDALINGIKALEACEDVTLLACPDVFAGATATTGDETTPHPLNDDGIKAVQQEMITHCDDMTDRFAILDVKQDLEVGDKPDWAIPKVSPRAAAYYPWLLVPQLDRSSTDKFVPPSGHIAGMFARVDFEKGVHKPPANESILGVRKLKHNVTRKELANLNQASVNCIRTLPGYDIRSWGARTLSDDPSWRYINVQRLVSNVSDSIADSIRWAVFEPNDEVLWAALRRDIGAYLTRLWRQGALFGKAPGEAFFVKCDESNNKPTQIEAGTCTVEIGLAPVKPAEFIVLQIRQSEGGSTSTVAGELITGA